MQAAELARVAHPKALPETEGFRENFPGFLSVSLYWPKGLPDGTKAGNVVKLHSRTS